MVNEAGAKKFMAPVRVDDALAKIVGPEQKPRTEITKKLWEYIKKNGLQDKVKKTNINADEALKVIFEGKPQVTMFEMTKFVNKHILKG